MTRLLIGCKKQGESPSYSPVSSVVTPAKVIETPRIEVEQRGEGAQGKKRRLFVGTEEVAGDSMPEEFRHIRKSERIVSDNITKPMF